MPHRKAPPKKRVVKYQPSIVTYLDILGFKSLVGQKTAGEISRILRIMKETVAPDPELAGVLASQVQYFSDLAVRVIPVEVGSKGYGDVFGELLSLVHIQYALLTEGILVRGGMTFGDIIKSWGLLYGPGLITAYQLEVEAIYPRLLIDSKLLFEHLRNNSSLRNHIHDYDSEMEYIHRLIRRDTDGRYFVDYLRAIESEYDYPESGYPTFLNFHKELIVNSLKTFKNNRSIRAKYEWLKAYHNSTMRNRFGKQIKKLKLYLI